MSTLPSSGYYPYLYFLTGYKVGLGDRSTARTSPGSVSRDFRYTVVANGVEITDYTGTAKSAQIPERLEGKAVVSIGEKAFYNNQLTRVIIPNGVTFIGRSAFYGNQLPSVTIPDSVTSIEYGAFSSNPLTSVTFQGSGIDLDDDAFGSFNGDLVSKYQAGGAGTYTSNGGGSWRKQYWRKQ
jgi:hypothetical protein